MLDLIANYPVLSITFQPIWSLLFQASVTSRNHDVDGPKVYPARSWGRHMLELGLHPHENSVPSENRISRIRALERIGLHLDKNDSPRWLAYSPSNHATPSSCYTWWAYFSGLANFKIMQLRLSHIFIWLRRDSASAMKFSALSDWSIVDHKLRWKLPNISLNI